MHRRTITLIGKLQCEGSGRRALVQYATLIESARTEAGRIAFEQTVDKNLPVGRSEVGELRNALCATPQLRGIPRRAVPPVPQI